MILIALTVVLGIVNLVLLTRLSVKLSDFDRSNAAWHTLHSDRLQEIRKAVIDDRDK